MNCEACGRPTPPDAHYCSGCGRKLEPTLFRRERHVVAVLIVDIAGFTAHTAALGAERMHDFAREVLTRLTQTVEMHDGRVDSYTGDGLVAIFGHPTPHADDADRAVLAGLDGLNAIERLGDRLGRKLRGRAGVAWGEAIVGGTTGDGQSVSVYGNPVNLASRLEASSQEGRLLCDAATKERLTDGHFIVSAVNHLALQGYATPTAVHHVTRALTQRAGAPEPVALRHAEGQQLTAALTQVMRSGRPRCVALVGPAGSGKRTLVHRTFRGQPMLHLPAPHALGQQLDWPTLLHDLYIAGHDKAGPKTLDEVLRVDLAEHPRLWSALRTSLHPLEANRWRRYERRHPDRVAVAWAELIGGYVRRHGGTAVMHWHQPPRGGLPCAFLNALKQLSVPLLIVRTVRQAGQAVGAHQTIELGPLALSHAGRLVGDDAWFARHGAALPRQPGALAAACAARQLPPTVRRERLERLAAARLSEADTASREAFAVLSTVGPQVFEGLAGELIDEPEGLEGVMTLGWARSTRSRVSGLKQWLLGPPALRIAAANRLAPEDRRRIHAHAAAWLERRPEPHLRSLTAIHHAHAEAFEEAAEQWLLAADAALAAGDGLRARLWLKRAEQASAAAHEPHERLAVWLRGRTRGELETLGLREPQPKTAVFSVGKRKIETQA